MPYFTLGASRMMITVNNIWWIMYFYWSKARLNDTVTSTGKMIRYFFFVDLMILNCGSSFQTCFPSEMAGAIVGSYIALGAERILVLFACEQHNKVWLLIYSCCCMYFISNVQFDLFSSSVMCHGAQGFRTNLLINSVFHFLLFRPSFKNEWVVCIPYIMSWTFPIIILLPYNSCLLYTSPSPRD